MHPQPLDRIKALAAYSPGLSIDESREKYDLGQAIKLASNENPLGASPLVIDAIRANAPLAFRYPRGGNPELARALAGIHDVDPGVVAIGNGSDEIIDLLIRILVEPAKHNVVCFEPCFSIYPLQARIANVETRRQPLNSDFSFDFVDLLEQVDENTRIVFVTTPDNPSGHCPPLEDVKALAGALATNYPRALLFVDEAYMDFVPEEKGFSLLANHYLPANVAVCRTFSKSWGLAGLRLGYAVLPPELADGFWRARLPFSVNILAERAALAALQDSAFRELTLATVREGREFLYNGLQKLGCKVWRSAANFLMFRLPPEGPKADQCFQELLRQGIIIRPLKSYGLADNFRVSVGNPCENRMFLDAMTRILQAG